MNFNVVESEGKAQNDTKKEEKVNLAAKIVSFVLMRY